MTDLAPMFIVAAILFSLSSLFAIMMQAAGADEEEDTHEPPD